jgi:hypothetical protein
LSKRKQGPREERRREQVEVNLLSQGHDRGTLAKARRGCTLPFLGIGLLVVALGLLHAGLS